MLKNIERSLTDLLGKDYINAVKSCAEGLGRLKGGEAESICEEAVPFYGRETVEMCEKLAGRIGERMFGALENTAAGAATDSYKSASNLGAAPIGGMGSFRIGENGRVYLAAKSEHYQTPLGHNFGGYALIGKARRLGILNATHNNTRGCIVRLLEREIIRTINGLGRDQGDRLESILKSEEPGVLNRVLNLETGSLACEAALKMMLSRFYKLDRTFGTRKYEGRVPVFLVMEDNDGGCQANYHGTTLLAQTLRGLWPEWKEQAEKAGMYRVVPVKINDIADFREKIEKYNRGIYKTAGFIHEIVLMNYGGILLEKEYLQAAYEYCRKYDTPAMADEIQSCMWYSGMYLFRHYGLKPDFVILGKGFSGGEYAASKVVTTAEMDNLNQFGALVTNGQQELSALAYLVTMEFVENNGAEIDEEGAWIEARLRELKRDYPEKIAAVEGKAHLSALHFYSVDEAVSFVKALNAQCVDISAQTYKANCPPAALLKLPLVISRGTVEQLVGKIRAALDANG